ncbi:uncharacterized protein LOC129312006 [Prosopis cineraria]|uniref:uncharacterized protein LOC129312006 n=1 Tax=Prosopis cineraria TaxID=364024 RepID=UPI00241001EF|nr:uncharacterized protein LOC129312006 [Prosopis cineraria]
MSMSSSESDHHHREFMELVIVPTNPFTKTKEADEGESVRKLLPTDSSNSIPPFPYDDPPLSESAPSPTAPNHQVQIQIPEPNPQPDDADLTHPVLEIIESQELGKAIIVMAVPMLMGLFTAYQYFTSTVEMSVVVISLCLAFASILNGILSRKTCPKLSILLLMSGIVLMILAFYAYSGIILPVYLKWIPVACFFLSILPLAPVFVGVIYSRRKKANN